MSLAPGSSIAEQQLQAVGSSIVPTDHFFLTVYNFKTSIELPLWGSTHAFKLSSISRPASVAITKTKQDVCSWLAVPGPGGQTAPGLRDTIQADLFGNYVSTAQTFSTSAGVLSALVAQIPPAGASEAQKQQAAAALATLNGVVGTAAAAIKALETRMAAFTTAILADIAALQSGPAAIETAIQGVPGILESWIEKYGGGILTGTAIAKMAEDFGTAYVTALKTLGAQMDTGLSAAQAVAPALLHLSSTWQTLAATTADVAGEIAAVEARSLADSLNALDLGTALIEWQALSQIAGGIATAMNSEGLYGQQQLVAL